MNTKKQHKRLSKTSKKLRNSSTKALELLAKILKNNNTGYNFQKHPPLENAIPDFYCAKLKLAILIDGSEHENKQVKTLKRMGVHVACYSSADIVEFPDIVDIDIAKRIETCENSSA